MSQNNKLLKRKGVPVLTKKQRNDLRKKWQQETWEDMIYNLEHYNKYIMLRCTGFGKTYTCACATNITDKKVLFIYKSEILKKVFRVYEKRISKPDIYGNSRIKYETYAMLGLHWGDLDYLKNILDGVGLIIFDEAQYMGARTYREALDKALPIIELLGIKYIGATATIERTDVDVCDKYFTHEFESGELLYCWGEHIYTLEDAFKSGLIIPPEYQFIDERDVDDIKIARHTIKSILDELKIELANCDNSEDKKEILKNMKELERSIIKDADKIIHDSLLTLYDCKGYDGYDYETLEEYRQNLNTSLPLNKPDKLPSYMRFLVFTPGRDEMGRMRKDQDSNEVFGGMVSELYDDFMGAFSMYGYRVRTTIISSLTTEEKNNVKYIDMEPSEAISEEEADKIVKEEPMVIDLIFSINMLNIGYHVNSITGLILKRWTGSNTIYYQQLGRCLSVDSDIIPIVYDFVKSIDSRGITAPLFAVDKDTKAVTHYADGTQHTNYKDIKSKPRINSFIPDKLDNTGKLINPKNINYMDAKYITVSMASASVSDILERQNVYSARRASKKLYEEAYNIYISRLQVSNNTLQNDITKAMPLYKSLRLAILSSYSKRIDSKTFTQNTKAYLEYLKKHNKDAYVLYDALKMYIEATKNGETLNPIAHEINSILAMCKTPENKEEGLNIKLLVTKENVTDLKINNDVKKILKDKQFNKSDFVVYE